LAQAILTQGQPYRDASPHGLPATFLPQLRGAMAPADCQAESPPLVVDGVGQEYAIVVTCGSLGNMHWEVIMQLEALRTQIQKQANMVTPPSVVVRTSANAGEQEIQIVACDSHGAAGCKQEDVICRASTVEKAQEQFAEKFGADESTVTFVTRKDRPGLLAEVSALFKVNRVNIRSAEIKTYNGDDKNLQEATHVYKAVDAQTGQRLSNQKLARLQEDFVALEQSTDHEATPFSGMRKGQSFCMLEQATTNDSEGTDVSALLEKVARLTKAVEVADAETVRLSAELQAQRQRVAELEGGSKGN